MELQFFHDLDKSEFEHPLDAKALQRLQNTRGFDKVVKKFYDMGIEKVMKLQYMGSSLKLGKNAFPELNDLVEQCCKVLNHPIQPDLYVERTEQIQTVAIGVENPIIVLASDCIDKLSIDELRFLIGREVAHIKCNHILYREIGIIFPALIDAFSTVTLGLSGVLSAGLRYALFNWAQMAQYTADRGGLLACQDVFVTKRIFSKIAGLPEKYWGQVDLSYFEDQANSFEGLNEKTFDKIMRFIYGNNLWAIARAHELIKWVESGEYNKLIVRKLKNN